MIASPLMQATADRIKALRAARALTQEDLAALAGRSVASVQRIERGEKVSAYTIASIAAAFDITAEALTAAPNDDRPYLPLAWRQYSTPPAAEYELPPSPAQASATSGA